MKHFPESHHVNADLLASIIPANWWKSDLFSEHYPLPYARNYRKFSCAAHDDMVVTCCAPMRCNEQCSIYMLNRFINICKH